MKLTTIFLLAACLQVSAGGFAQKVSISVKSASLQEVFLEIYRQTGYQVFYQDVVVDKSDKVTIDVKDAPVEEVLSECLSNLGLTFSITDNAIVLKQVSQPTVPQPGKSTIPPVTGKVIDPEGNPMPGVVVMIKGTQRGVATDINGHYELPLQISDRILVFSFLGMKTVEVEIK